MTNSRQRAFVWTRLVAISLGFPLALAFIVSSPGRAAFWVVLGAAALVMLPGVAVSVHFLTDKS